MLAWSPDGGLWITCFACGVPADATVLLCGTSHGQPIQLERGACHGCLSALLTAELPLAMGAHDILLQVAAFTQMFDDLELS